MNEIQQLVEEIQAILAEPARPQFETIDSLNRALMEMVNRMNGRLRRCDALLSQGLRTEAIQLAEQAPDVLTAISYLDFPEWDEWAGLVREDGLNAPPEPLIEIAAEINQSYTVASALEHHLNQHRVLALARAPLSKRLMVMRKIRRLDADNPIWQDDILVFEKQRFEQIRNEVQVAAQQGNADILATLEQELTSTPWQKSPSQKLVSRTVAAHKQSRMLKAEQELRTLEPKLTEAFAELDLEKARPLRSRWNALMQIAGPTANDSILEIQNLVQPALNWLEETDQTQAEDQAYEQAVFNLEQAITDQKPAEELQAQYHEATKAGRNLTPHLYQRYTDSLQHQETRSRRKFFLLVSGTLVSLLIVGLLLGYLIRKSNQDQQIAEHAATLHDLVQSGKLTRAQEYREQLKPQPWILESPEIQQHSARLDEALEQEQGRSKQFQAKLNQISSRIHPQMNWEEIAQVESAVPPVSQLAVTADEKVQLERLKLTLARERSDLQQQFDNQFKQDLNVFTNRIQSLPEEEMVAINNALTSLHELQQRNHISKSLKNDLPKLKVMLEDKQAIMRREEDLQRQYQNISRSIGDFDRYQKGLEEYILKFPETSHSNEFKKIIQKELPLWKKFVEWRQPTQEWEQIQIRELTPQAARKLLEKVNTLEAASKPLPVPVSIQQLRPAVTAITGRVGENQIPVYRPLLEILKGPLYSNLNLVLTQNNKRYYTLEVPDALGSRLLFKKFDNISLTRSDKFSIDRSEVIMPEKSPDQDWSSPQSRFTRSITAKVPEALNGAWESIFITLLQELYADEKMEPILKYQLLRSVLELGCKGSLPLKEVFADDLITLSAVNVDPAANWIDPDDPRALFARKQVTDKLKEFSSPLKKQAEIEKAFAKLEQIKPDDSYRWVGWISRNSKGKPVMRINVNHPPQDTGELMVIVPDAEPENVYQPVGTINKGKFHLNPPVSPEAATQIYKAGRAVFVKSK
ncbi:coiled-coil domain-containing protein [Gimesia algae]|uniref:Uncharacterized protein n=1 Tax=Gimesia algae TaxID=2527971 RepID=A0A517VKW5_9PLAN|nr:hypothetical protein [Gimesia algae]QDT93663.1 hypothetical protein Pan161_53450 [Gimesia algae]